VTVGGALYIAVAAARDVLRLFRWAMWEGPVTWLDLKESVVAVPLVWVYQVENVIELGVLFAAVVALWGVLWWLIQPIRVVHSSQVRSGRMASGLPEVVDVFDDKQVARVAAAFNDDVVGRVLRSLAVWRPHHRITNEAELQSSLWLHFAESGFSVAREVWMGRAGRVDLVLDESVAVELKFGALRANERNRVMGQSTTYANYWSGRGPILVVCVDAPESRIREVSLNAESWNRTLAERNAGDLPAPILVVKQLGTTAGNRPGRGS
jgi:hypothetical protein